MASLKGRHFSFSDRLYFRKIFQLAGKGHTNVSALWRKGDPTMQTEISLKGQYKNTVFSFISPLKSRGEGCGSGRCLACVCLPEGGLPLAWDQHLHSVSGPRFSLKQQIAFTPHPACVLVHLGGKQAAPQISTVPGRGARRQQAQSTVPLSLPILERSCGWGLFWMSGLGIFNQTEPRANHADCELSRLPAL